MKRIIGFILVITMVISALPLNCFAADGIDSSYSITFNNIPPEVNKMSAISDGQALAEKGGKQCWESLNKYLYCNVDDLKAGEIYDLRITVEYFDENEGAGNGQFFLGANQGEIEHFYYSNDNTKTWKTKTFDIKGIKGKGYNGQDFVLCSVWSGVPVYIASVKVDILNIAGVTANVPSGNVAKGTEITLSTTQAGASIYFTTDGTDPKTSATKQLYTTPLVVNGNMTIKAYAKLEGVGESDVATFSYYTGYNIEFNGMQPQGFGMSAISEGKTVAEKGGKTCWENTNKYLYCNVDDFKSDETYNVNVTVEYFDENAGGAQFYFGANQGGIEQNFYLNGDNSMAWKTASFIVKGLKGKGYNGQDFVISSVWSGVPVYIASVRVETFVEDVTASIPSGKVPKGTQIELSNTTGNAQIYYTVDSSDPRTSASRQLYSTPISVSGNLIIKAYAVNGNTESQVTSFSYYDTPAIILNGFPAQSFGMTANEGGKAIVEKGGKSCWESTDKYAYFNVDEYEAGKFYDVEISIEYFDDGGQFFIYYANDTAQSNPTDNFYMGQTNAWKTAKFTIKGLKAKSHNGLDFCVCSYWSGTPVNISKVAVKKIEPSVEDIKTNCNSEEIDIGTEIKLSTITPEAEIYYTIDGSDPLTSETRHLYTTPVVYNGDILQIKAYGKKAGINDSEVATFFFRDKDKYQAFRRSFINNKSKEMNYTLNNIEKKDFEDSIKLNGTGSILLNKNILVHNGSQIGYNIKVLKGEANVTVRTMEEDGDRFTTSKVINSGADWQTTTYDLITSNFTYEFNWLGNKEFNKDSINAVQFVVDALTEDVEIYIEPFVIINNVKENIFDLQNTKTIYEYVDFNTGYKSGVDSNRFVYGTDAGIFSNDEGTEYLKRLKQFIPNLEACLNVGITKDIADRMKALADETGMNFSYENSPWIGTYEKLNRDNAWEVNWKGIDGYDYDAGMRMHAAAMGHATTFEAAKDVIDAVAKTGFLSLNIFDWIWDWQYRWGWNTETIKSFRQSLDSTPGSTLNLRYGNKIETWDFWKYFEDYTGLKKYYPSDVGLTSWEEFMPVSESIASTTTDVNVKKQYFLYNALFHYEFLKFTQKVAYYCQEKGILFEAIPNPEDIGNGVDYRMLLRLDGIQNIYHESFAWLMQLPANYYGARYFNRIAQDAGSELSTCFEVGPGGHDWAYWDPELFYMFSFSNTASGQADHMKLDFLDNYGKAINEEGSIERDHYLTTMMTADAFNFAKDINASRPKTDTAVIAARSVMQYEAPWTNSLEHRYGLSKTLGSLGINFDLCGTEDMDTMINEYKNVYVGTSEIKKPFWDKLINWCSNGNTLITHSFVPASFVNGQFNFNATNWATWGGADKYYRDHLKPVELERQNENIKIDTLIDNKITEVNSKMSNYFNVGDVIANIGDKVYSYKGARPLVKIGDFALISEVDQGNGKMIYVGYPMGESKTQELDQKVIEAINAYLDIEQKVICEKPAYVLPYETSLGKAVYISDFKDVSDASYKKGFWQGKSKITYENESVNTSCQYLAEPNKAYVVYEMITGEKQTVTSDSKGYITLINNGKTGSLYFIIPDGDTKALNALVQQHNKIANTLEVESYNLKADKNELKVGGESTVLTLTDTNGNPVDVAGKTIYYKVNDQAIATVTEADGKAALVTNSNNKAGMVTVKAMVEEGRVVKYSNEIVVNIIGESKPIPPTPDPDPKPDPTPTPDSNIKVETVEGNIVKVTFSGSAISNLSGDVKVAINNSSYSNLISKINANEDAKTILIDIPKVAGAKSYSVELPKEAVILEDKGCDIVVKTELGTVTVPQNMFSDGNLAGKKTVAFKISMADTAGIDKGVLNQIGDRPVFEIEAAIDGKNIEWSNNDTAIKVGINYVPSEKELKKPEHLTVWYIDDKGQKVIVPNARYDAKLGQVVFTTPHLSKYAVAFVEKKFKDTQKAAWAEKQIEVLASKGIIHVDGDYYKPQTNITRGEFISMLIRALGLTATKGEDFSDVKAGDQYYNEVSVAKKLGITSGMGDNKFNPDREISRQDAFVITQKALDLSKKLNIKGDVSGLDQFRDASNIANYAKEAIASLVKAELVCGQSNNSMNPKGNITKAEASALVYNCFNR